MKRFQVLLGVGGIALVVGLNILVLSLIPKDSGLVAASFTIPRGERWHYLYEHNMGPGMTLEGDFRVPAGAPVRVIVLSASQYETYLEYGAVGAPLFQQSGTSGTFSFSPDSAGTYFLIFEHLSNTNAQNVNVNWRLHGNNYMTALVGGLVAAIGAGFLAWGFREKRQAALLAPPPLLGPDPAASVVFFPPPPPSAQVLPNTPGGAHGPEGPHTGPEDRPDHERGP